MIKKIVSTIIIGLAYVGTALAATSVTKDNITWEFDDDYTVGQFVTGDWYVVAPAGLSITAITSIIDNMSGTVVNPISGTTQGYSDSAYGYDSEIDISLSLPYPATSGDTIVSTTSHTYITAEQTYVDEAAILEIVSEQPPVGSFRPGYCDTSNVMFNESRIDYSTLGDMTLTSSAPDIPDVVEMFARPWIDHKLGWTGRQIHPNKNMRDYGSEISTDVGIGALMLNSDIPVDDKRNIVIGYVQLGIDLYSVVKSGGSWAADGGHSSGRKFPILFAGKILDSQDMLDVANKSGVYGLSLGAGEPPDDYINFGEDDQTFIVSQDDIDITNSDLWNPDDRNTDQHPYSTAMEGMPEWGVRHTVNPEQSASEWDTYYRQCCTAYSWHGWVLSAIAMGIDKIWNNDALFKYMRRYYAISNGDVDPFGFVVMRESSGYPSSDAFTLEMWESHHGDFGSGKIDAGTGYLSIGTGSLSR